MNGLELGLKKIESHIVKKPLLIKVLENTPLDH